MKAIRLSLLISCIAASFCLATISYAQQIETSIFPKEISIKGKHLPFKAPFQDARWDVDIFVRDNTLLYKNNGERLRIFDIRKLTLIADLGFWGDPVLSPPYNNSYFCDIADEGKIFHVKKDRSVQKTSQYIYSQEYGAANNLPWLVQDFGFVKDSVWLFAGKSSNGFSLFKTTYQDNKLVTQEFLQLNLNADQKKWEGFIGPLCLRQDRTKAVYAYSYYPIIKIVDLELKTVQTIKQSGISFNPETMNEVDGHGLNVRHYENCFAGEKYFYCLHIGRKSVDFFKDNKNKNTYIYIEQFDWEGNPIQRIKLDKFGGRFCVDEEKGKLYLVTLCKTGSPIYEYDIPQ